MYIRGSKHLETIKALGLRPRAFICFSVFVTPDETLALVFDMLRVELIIAAQIKKKAFRRGVIKEATHSTNEYISTVFTRPTKKDVIDSS